MTLSAACRRPCGCTVGVPLRDNKAAPWDGVGFAVAAHASCAHALASGERPLTPAAGAATGEATRERQWARLQRGRDGWVQASRNTAPAVLPSVTGGLACAARFSGPCHCIGLLGCLPCTCLLCNVVGVPPPPPPAATPTAQPSHTHTHTLTPPVPRAPRKHPCLQPRESPWPGSSTATLQITTGAGMPPALRLCSGITGTTCWACTLGRAARRSGRNRSSRQMGAGQPPVRGSSKWNDAQADLSRAAPACFCCSLAS